MRKPSLATQLVAYRDARSWTNQALAEYLSKSIGIEVKVRAVENWNLGRQPHPIWRSKIMEALKS